MRHGGEGALQNEQSYHGQQRGGGERRHAVNGARTHRAGKDEERDDQSRAECVEAGEALARVEECAEGNERGDRGEREGEEERVPGEPVIPEPVGAEGDRDEHDGENTTSHAP